MFPKNHVYIPRQLIAAELEKVAKRFWEINNTTIIIEEFEQFIPQGRAIPPYTDGLIRMGRNWGIGIWGTTRRIQRINKEFFDLAQHIIMFRCGLRSRQYISDMIGEEYVRLPAVPKYNKTGYCLTTLPPFHALYFNLEEESAEVFTLVLGAREHVQEVTKKSPADVRMDKLPDAQDVLQGDTRPKAQPHEEEPEPTEEGGAGKEVLWTPRRK